MLAHQASYPRANNVLPVPEDNGHRKQGMHYAIFHFFLPQIKPARLIAVFLLCIAIG